MADRMTLSWQGQQFEAVRKTGRDAAPEPGPVWQVLRDGAPVTSFAAEPNEGAADVKDKIVAWLEANRTRPAMDVGRQ
jgi:hypothetical protein